MLLPREPRRVPHEREVLGKGRSWGSTVQDLLLGENPLVSTKMHHEVGGDSAEVNGQEIPVIVGVGSIFGKTVVAGRAGRVVAAHVEVGLYSLFLLTVSVKAVLPLWARKRDVKGLDIGPFPPHLPLPLLPHTVT